MKPNIAAVCAIVAFATLGGRALVQFPDCAYLTLFDPCPLSIEAHGQCEHSPNPREVCQGCPSGAQAFYVESGRKDGEVKVTIGTTLWDVVPGNSTFTDEVLTLAPGERRKLGCAFSGQRPRILMAY